MRLICTVIIVLWSLASSVHSLVGCSCCFAMSPTLSSRHNKVLVSLDCGLCTWTRSLNHHRIWTNLYLYNHHSVSDQHQREAKDKKLKSLTPAGPESQVCVGVCINTHMAWLGPFLPPCGFQAWHQQAPLHTEPSHKLGYYTTTHRNIRTFKIKKKVILLFICQGSGGNFFHVFSWSNLQRKFICSLTYWFNFVWS